MRWITVTLSILICSAVATGCSGHKPYHEHKLGDPVKYQAHFPDMDADSDDAVSWEEFKSYFPETDRNVYNALDINGDGAVDHDEWHAFKEAHGMRDHD